jgi:hypothetical protein
MAHTGWEMPDGAEDYSQYTEFPHGTDALMNGGQEPLPQLTKIMRARCDAQYRLLEVLLAAGLLKDPDETGNPDRGCRGCGGTCCTGLGSDPCTC